MQEYRPTHDFEDGIDVLDNPLTRTCLMQHVVRLFITVGFIPRSSTLPLPLLQPTNLYTRPDDSSSIAVTPLHLHHRSTLHANAAADPQGARQVTRHPDVYSSLEEISISRVNHLPCTFV